MLQAQLEGKLTGREEDLEDLLTSNVFGSIKYVPPEEGLLPLLASSVDGDGNVLIHDLPSTSSQPEYKFWPSIHEPECEGCKPDVQISIQLLNSQKIIVFVEAKYLSDKSSQASEEGVPTDQLACEWDNLTHLAHRENATPMLLYVTADIGYPKESVEESRQEYMRKRRKDMSVFWISWRKLPRLFSGKKQDILRDLVKVLQRQRLTYYEGIKKPEPTNVKWSFKAMVNWPWSLYERRSICWNYQARKNYIWKYGTEPIQWRFKK